MHERELLIPLVALLVSYAVCMATGHLYIALMQKKHIGQAINPDVPPAHQAKRGTPTSGGLFLLCGITVSVLLFSPVTHPYTFIPLIFLWAYASIGLLDDVLKILHKQSVGLRTSRKLALQIVVSALMLYLLNQTLPELSKRIFIPWKNMASWDLGIWYPLVFLLFMVTFVNAVNISDGLDGLAAGSAVPPLVLIGVIAAVYAGGLGGQTISSPVAQGSYDLLVVVTAALGGLLAFLWYNGSQAQVFMGDCGSHAIGALLAISAILLHVEVIVVVACLMFLVECASSLIQIISIRLFGAHVFALAPLHHHFEIRGIQESRIVVRFQISSALWTVLGGILFLLWYVQLSL